MEKMKNIFEKLLDKRLKLIFVCIILILLAGCITNYNSVSNKNIKSASGSYTLAFISDAKPELGKNLNKLINDFNQIIPQSPTGKVDAVVWIGDMEPIKLSDRAYDASTAKNIPVFYVLGNHELNNKIDLLAERLKFANYSYSPNPGPEGSRNTTYSFDIGNMHVIVLNEYWDGDNDNKCNWHIPSGGLDTDESCNKYSADDGGYIPGQLFKWIEDDLTSTNKKWIIVTGHEPLYPYGNHIGDSLDENQTNRNKLESLLVSKNVTAFVSGHTHISHIQKIKRIIHANAGLYGDNVGNGDKYSTIIYIYVDETGNFNIVRKFGYPIWNNSNNSGWNNSSIETITVS